MQRGVPLSIGETYHVYNRGAHKALIYREDQDYDRFTLLLYLANGEMPLNMRDLSNKYKGRSFVDAYSGEDVGKTLVDVLAYSLMPNHFHLIIRQKTEDGIARFLKKIGTAYSMYFNGKYEHSGTVFQGRYKSVHVGDEPQYRWLFSYVHLNPASLHDPEWERRGIVDSQSMRQFINRYRYSSYPDYQGKIRAEGRLLATDVPDFLREQSDLEEMLSVFTKDRPL